MTYEQPSITQLQEFGYTEREAHFLYVASIHSGVFTRDHFTCFCGVADGRPTQQLCEKVQQHGHARKRELTIQNGKTGRPIIYYHLFSKSIYRAVGQPHSSNRKEHAFRRLLQKIYGLTFIITHPDFFYFLSEQQRLAYFVREQNIASNHLPMTEFVSAHSKDRTARYFVDKFPMGIAPDGTLICTYIDDETERGGIASHFARYAPLWRRLSVPMKLHFVSRTARNFEFAREQFELKVSHPQGPLASMVPEVLEYFRLQLKRETSDPVHWSYSDMARRSELAAKYDSERVRLLYSEWKESGTLDPSRLDSVFVAAARDFLPVEVRKCGS